jgi:hypothetical protein
MLKNLLILLIVMLLIFFSVRCNYRTPVTKTITTNYGETFEIIVYFRQSLHDDYLEYHFQRSDGKFLIIYSIPVNYEGGLDQDPFKLIEHVAQNEYIKLYKIEDCIIYSTEKTLYVFDLENLRRLYNYVPEQLEYVEDKDTFLYDLEKILEALIETKQLEYMKYCATYLLENGNTSLIPLIKRWQRGNISEEEIAINAKDGYTKDDLIDWANQFEISNN